jgi:hypothetical protein
MKCEHKWRYAEEIQQGYKVSGWRCKECDEWLDDSGDHDCHADTGDDGCDHPSHKEEVK